MSKSIPKAALEKITQIQTTTKISREEITQDYLSLYNDPFVQEDPQFTSDEERVRYAIMVLHTRYMSRPPAQEYQIVVVGVGSIRTGKNSGQPSASVFAVAKKSDSDKPVFKRIVLRGNDVNRLNQITPFAMYTTKLGEFKGTDGDLIADNRSRFDAPGSTVTPDKILGLLPIKKLTISEAKKFPSATREVGGKSYVIETDWRVIRGIITRSKASKRKDGTPYGMYGISDDSVSDEPTVMPDGQVIPPGMTVWISPAIMTFEVESECDFYGNVQINGKTGEPMMNAYLVLPVHAREVKPGGEQE